MRITVTGGAGYVGSVTVERLLAAGHEVTVLDSLITGHRDAVPQGAKLVEGNVGDPQVVETALRDSQSEAVLHCAALSLVGESMTAPDRYFRNNVVEGVGMLDGIRAAGVRRVVFSSSAAVYGAPTRVPIEETDPLAPINTYGSTKLAFEHALTSYARAYGWGVVSLRYFNACGASETYGEDHDPETHLIPNVLRGALGGAAVKIFGTDYDTPDGTAVRDYIHVLDLADAHLAALEHTAGMDAGHVACNLGSGSGFSVLEVVRAAESVVGRPIPHEFGPRRSGDPTTLVASSSKARELLGWEARRGTLGEMIGSAWNWHQGHPHGYED
jgi:UDP-glucose 4-epimerase